MQLGWIIALFRDGPGTSVPTYIWVYYTIFLTNELNDHKLPLIYLLLISCED